jgi:hypothetical protein
MKKLIVSIIILIITKSISKTSVIVDLIYDNKKPLDNTDNIKNDFNKNSDIDKKQEILDSLNYLKLKKVKTKQDKESIYTLEMILRNMK